MTISISGVRSFEAATPATPAASSHADLFGELFAALGLVNGDVVRIEFEASGSDSDGSLVQDTASCVLGRQPGGDVQLAHATGGTYLSWVFDGLATPHTLLLRCTAGAADLDLTVTMKATWLGSP